MINFEQWEGFEGRIWKEEVNVRDFIQKNYTPYDGDESFLAGPTEATDKLWGALQKLQKAERAKGGVLDMETEVVSSLTAYGPGYIDESLKDLEQIVGLQTDKPLKRAFMPYGGIKMAEQACTTYGYQPSEELHKIFTDYTRTHNQAVFDAYTPEMKAARHTHIITGLPDTYGRGRIVGDYRRVALYGIDALIKFKQEDFANCGDGTMTDDVIRLREEIARQISALKGMKKMAEAYGYDISQPAKNAKEACQWLYFGYLGIPLWIRHVLVPGLTDDEELIACAGHRRLYPQPETGAAGGGRHAPQHGPHAGPVQVAEAGHPLSTAGRRAAHSGAGEACRRAAGSEPLSRLSS